MPIKLANNASGTLATAISASDTGIVLTTGNGALFPTLGAGEYFYATLVSSQGTQEIVKATARVGDALTIVRAQEGTVVQSFAAGARFELRVTAASITDLVDEHDQASEISFVPTGSIAATNVQAALAELADPTAVNVIGNGVQTIFAIAVKPAAVYINGVYQDKNTWAYSGGNVTFSEAPPLTSVIEFVI